MALTELGKPDIEANRNEMDDNLIFHYTTSDGIIGILKNQKLWLSLVNLQNDSSELALIADLLPIAIADLKKEYDFDETTMRLLDELPNTNKPYPIIDNVFTLSFSRDGNSMNLWKSYTGNKAGFSIGFDKKLLDKVIDANLCYMNVCEYDAVKQVELLKSEIIDYFESIRNEVSDYVWKDIHLSWKVYSCAPILKSAHFSDEKEIRVIHNVRFIDEVRKKAFKYRANRGLLVPYFEIDISENFRKLIRKVVVGPGHNRETAKLAIDFLLDDIGLDKKNILEFSEIPLRY